MTNLHQKLFACKMPVLEFEQVLTYILVRECKIPKKNSNKGLKALRLVQEKKPATYDHSEVQWTLSYNFCVKYM
jgi:hypothetical protein